MKALLRKILLSAVCLTAYSLAGKAQFKEEAFRQSYNDPRDTTAVKDSVDQMWTFREFFRGISHKDDLRIGSMFGGSIVFIGAEQIYNKQYWKLPLVYGGLGATIGMGLKYRRRYKADASDTRARDLSDYMFAGAGFLYWCTLMDGVIQYKRDIRHQPGKATIYSILLPGLGQAYNGEYWKIPIYWGGIIGSCHFLSVNNTNYRRFKRIHNEATNPEVTYGGPIPAERALYYRDVYRRYRDYSIVALVGFYLLQVIDANVFAYMQDFEVSEDLTMRVTPAVITPYAEYASSLPLPACVYGGSAIGIRIGFNF